MAEIVIVTGGSRGIGAATARLLGDRGASVVVNYRAEKDAAEAVAQAVEAAGGRAATVAGDMGEEADILRLFAETERLFGTPTGLVNNAGIVGGGKRRLEQLTAEVSLRVMRVNVIGPLLCAREAARRMSTRHGGKGGAIVNVSSIGARTGSPFAFLDYAASKGAVDTMTVGMAAELAKCGVRVNGVRPGMIDTDVHASAGMPDRVARHGASMPVGRAGEAAEVAEAIVWLLSDKASYVTGAVLDVAGGVR